MWTKSPETSEPVESDRSGETDRSSRARRILSAIRDRTPGGTVPLIAGGLLLVGAARAATRNRRRAGAQALLGGALLGVGVRRRRSTGDTTGTRDRATDSDEEGRRSGSTGSEVSAEARAHLERSDVLHQAETNPRGVSAEPDVETETDQDEGDVQFTTEQDEGPEPKPHLDGDDPGDPRRPDQPNPVTDDHVEVDLSEAAMADEASEATGPDPEQAYPSREGTDPEPHSEEAPERYGQGAVANEDIDGESETGDGESETGDEEEEASAGEAAEDEEAS